MLYFEFLEGTQTTENKWTYKEYKRIEAIYMSSETMTKAEAYKLYQAPDAFTQMLLDELKSTDAAYTDYFHKYNALKVKHDDLETKYNKEHNLRLSLQTTIEEAAQQAHKLYYTLTD